MGATGLGTYHEDPHNVLLYEVAEEGQVKNVEIEIPLVKGEELKTQKVISTLNDHGYVVVRVWCGQAIGTRPHEVDIHDPMLERQRFTQQTLHKRQIDLLAAWPHVLRDL
jgi:hypothetical protein